MLWKERTACSCTRALVRTNTRGYIIINVPPVLQPHTPTHMHGIYDESQITPPVHQKRPRSLHINTHRFSSAGRRGEERPGRSPVPWIRFLFLFWKLTWLTFITFNSVSNSVLWSSDGWQTAESDRGGPSWWMDSSRIFNEQTLCLRLQGIKVTPLRFWITIITWVIVFIPQRSWILECDWSEAVRYFCITERLRQLDHEWRVNINALVTLILICYCCYSNGPYGKRSALI